MLDATVLGTAGSVRDTLAHIAGAEAGYVASLTGTPPPLTARLDALRAEQTAAVAREPSDS